MSLPSVNEEVKKPLTTIRSLHEEELKDEPLMPQANMIPKTVTANYEEEANKPKQIKPNLKDNSMIRSEGKPGRPPSTTFGPFNPVFGGGQ